MGGSPKRGGSNGGGVLRSRGRVILVAVLALQLVLVVCLMKAPRSIWSSTREEIDAPNEAVPAGSSSGSWLWQRFRISTTAPNCTDASGRVVTEAVKGSAIECSDRISLSRLNWIEPKQEPKRKRETERGEASAKGPALRKVNATTIFRNSHGNQAELREGRSRLKRARAIGDAPKGTRVEGDLRQERVQIGRDLPATGDTTMASDFEEARGMKSASWRLRREFAANLESSLERDSLRFRARTVAYGDRGQRRKGEYLRSREEEMASARMGRVDASNVSAAIAPGARISPNASDSVAPVASIGANVGASVVPTAGIGSNVSTPMAPGAVNVSDSMAPLGRNRPSAHALDDKQPDEEEPEDDELAEADPEVAVARSEVSFDARRGPLLSLYGGRSSTSLEISPRNTSLAEMSTRNTSLPETSSGNLSLAEISAKNTSLGIPARNTSLEASPHILVSNKSLEISASNTSLNQNSESLSRISTRSEQFEQVPSPLIAPSVAALNATLRNATAATASPNTTCPQGLLYVYKLPKKFNTELLENCSQLFRGDVRCEQLSNSGLGSHLRSTPLHPNTSHGPWYATDQFSGEVIFHHRLLAHPCRTHNPELAHAFFIPYYGGLDVSRYLFDTADQKFTIADRDKLGKALVAWLSRSPYWKRRRGIDHVLYLGRITWDFRREGNQSWGSGLIYMPVMANVTKLGLERRISDERETAVPYPTAFHPRNDSEVEEWQKELRGKKRELLFSFAGGKRIQFSNDFRGALIEQCEKAKSCVVLDCTHENCLKDALSTIKHFMRSTFCLQPRGDSYTRRSIFDALVSGCIPVFFWDQSAYLQYLWHLPSDPSSYSIFIPKQDIEAGRVQIQDVLSKITPARVRQLQDTVLDMIPRLVYAQGLEKFRDAFDTTIDHVMAKFQARGHQNDTSNMIASAGDARDVDSRPAAVAGRA